MVRRSGRLHGHCRCGSGNLKSLTPQSSSELVRVRSHGRIHFGLLEISESEPNCYGGIGLMIDNSAAILQATISHTERYQSSIMADDYWLPRIETVSIKWSETHADLPVDSIRVIESPSPHQGMGSGTQMACTVVALLSAAERKQNHPETVTPTSLTELFTVKSLSKHSQRGKRSNIGLCGFLEGGFVVDRGMTIASSSNADTVTRTQRVNFPDWPVLILQDTDSRGDSGDDEARMFERCSRTANPNRERMMETVEQEILPAIASQDWDSFNNALGRYGRWAGTIFEPVQGGVYRSPKIAHTIEIAIKLGLMGATQSSWGPTVCAFAQDAEHAKWCHTRLREQLPSLNVSMTRAANGPAQVEWL